MPFTIVCGDITQMHTDAIVNAANTELQKGGGVCGAIYNAAGTDKLQAACAPLAPIRTGEAVLTPGFNLFAKYVIHTAGPVYVDGGQGERELLRQCYQNALKRAAEKGCESVAFPLISSGIYGYPKAEALAVASEEMRRFLSQENCDMNVVLVLNDKSSFTVGGNLLGEVRRYARWCCTEEDMQSDGTFFAKPQCDPLTARAGLPEQMDAAEESLAETVLRFIRKSGTADAEVCIRANIDRKLLNQILSDKAYKPGKQTAIALAVALDLTLEETHLLLHKAGYALSRSQVFDVIIEYFLTYARHDVYEINEVLFHYDQPLLGGSLVCL